MYFVCLWDKAVRDKIIHYCEPFAKCKRIKKSFEVIRKT